jgi:hypothetical protein
MIKVERISEAEIRKVEKINNLLRWLMSGLVAVSIISLLFIWLFYQP